MADAPTHDSQSLRRTQSTGDIPTVAQPARARISASHRRSTQRGMEASPSSSVNNAEPAEPTSWLRQAGQTPSESLPGQSSQASLRPSRPLLQRLKDLLGMGPSASRTRKALVSLIGTLLYNMLQAVAVISVLSVASVVKSPQDPSTDQVHACGRPLAAWNCIWLVRLAFSSGLTYWNYLRIRTADNASRGDSESSAQPGDTQPTRSGESRHRRQQDRGTSTATNSEDPPVPYNHIYARLSLFLSMFTLTWFLTAHILEYTSVDSCRLSAPLVWWLTFGILCTMYLLVLEVILFGFLVFMVLPFIMLFYSIILLCLGRHPLQNPHYIKPDIGKLSKTLVDRIPLVIYIPPPPDDTSAPVSLPKPVHTYPPKPPALKPRRRFAFLRKKTKKDSVMDPNVKDRSARVSTPETIKAPETWEDNWEQCEYPFVRLEGNRAACAICLMDFEEPKRLSAIQQDADKEVAPAPSPSPSPPKEVVIPVENITEEERDSLPRLEDAGEGPQPLRLLACGHVFHKTCIDPWLTDVSGRCPVCQRRVEIDEEPLKKSKLRRR